MCTAGTYETILWCFSERNAVPPRSKFNTDVTYHEGLPVFDKHCKKSSLIILDDLLDKAYSSDVSSLFTKGCHHRNISVILITQNLFHQSAHSRDISLNTKYMVLFKNLRDKNQITFLARQVYPEDWRSFYKAFQDATRKPHGYLLIDFCQGTNDLVRFRTNIFPSEVTRVYVPVKDEKDKIPLSYVTSS